MLRNYSERLHGREATRPDVTYTFGGAVVETTVEMPVLENDPTKPRENESFELKPGLTTEEEIKAYILDVLNHIDEYNVVVDNVHYLISPQNAITAKLVINNYTEYSDLDTDILFSNGTGYINYHPNNGTIYVGYNEMA